MRIQRPTGANAVVWAAATELAVSIVVEADGERYEAKINPTGGVLLGRDGQPIEWVELAFEPRWGFIGVDPNIEPSAWPSVATKRLGETVTTYRAWVEVARQRGGAVATTIEVYAHQAPAPAIAYHRSIAFVDSGSTSATGGYGTTISFSHTAGAGSNRYALVLGSLNGDPVPTSQAITLGGSSPDDANIVNWTDGNAAPPSGTWHLTTVGGYVDGTIGSGAKTVQTVRTGGNDAGGAAIGIVVYSGVEQGTSYGGVAQHGGTTGQFSATATGVGATDVVIGALGYFNTNPTAGTNETERVSADSGVAGVWFCEQAGVNGGVIAPSGLTAEFAGGALALKEAAAVGVVLPPSRRFFTNRAMSKVRRRRAA